jgi:para-aminobenzoate synthetase component 1
MHSVITGKLKDDKTSLELIKDCFPPGSMTGAPKIRAMEICSELEKHKRGIYSGALGYLSEDGSCEFSVVIRTLIIKGNKFEFQVGGGITYDSVPEKEWEETMLKAKAISILLGGEKEIASL